MLQRAHKVWLGHRGNTRFLPGFSVFPGGGSESGETDVETALRELSEETGLNLEEDNLTPFARAITPAYSKYRYDVKVFRAELPATQEPLPDGKEFLDGHWYTSDELFQAWRTGHIQLAPPTLRQLMLWSDCITGEQAWPQRHAAFAAPPERNEQVLPMSPGLTVIPLRTRAMPPAAWTNAAILGEQELLVLDPGGPDVSVLLEELQRLTREGAKIKGVLLSHHHPDHLEGYHQLELAHLPLYCHSITADLLPEDFPKPQLLKCGETLSLGPEYTVRTHFTPGHAPGHLAFEVVERKALLAGDMISSLSSIVIPSDNGNLLHYLESLEKLRNLQCNLIVPSHGPPYGKGSDPFGQAMAHRRKREEQVVKVLEKGSRTPEEITHILYRGLDNRLFPAARANVRHYLWKLQKEGRADEDDSAWTLLRGAST